MSETEKLMDFQMLRTRGYSMVTALALVELRCRYLEGEFSNWEG